MDEDPNKGSNSSSGENTKKSSDTIENDDETGSGESVPDGEGTSNSRNDSSENLPATDQVRPSESNGDAGSRSENIDNHSDDNSVFAKPLPPPPPLLPAPVTGHSADYEHNGDTDRNDDSGKSDSDRTESDNEGMSDNASNSSSGSHKTKKSNRCQVCRKKVGLTGFMCRCGGLYCSVHRYSDKHDCTFNYRELGAEEIRKNNPVVLGEKIHKI